MPPPHFKADTEKHNKKSQTSERGIGTIDFFATVCTYVGRTFYLPQLRLAVQFRVAEQFFAASDFSRFVVECSSLISPPAKKHAPFSCARMHPPPPPLRLGWKEETNREEEEKKNGKSLFSRQRGGRGFSPSLSFSRLDNRLQNLGFREGKRQKKVFCLFALRARANLFQPTTDGGFAYFYP